MSAVVILYKKTVRSSIGYALFFLYCSRKKYNFMIGYRENSGKPYQNDSY